MSDTYRPKLNLPKPAVNPQHPLLNAKSHDRLLEYAKSRMEPAKQQRNRNRGRWTESDRNLIGWLRLSQEELSMQRERARTGKSVALTMNLPIGLMKLIESMAFLMQIFVPRSGIYQGIGSAAELDSVTAITKFMNMNAQMSPYYMAYHQFFMACLKYNLGFYTNYWHRASSRILQNKQPTDIALWEGNVVEALDTYNTFTDTTTHPLVCHRDGEYFGYAKVRSMFWLQREALANRLFNVERVMDEVRRNTMQKREYYLSPAEEIGVPVTNDGVDQHGGTNWYSFFGVPGFSAASVDIVEVLTVYVHLIPGDWNLVTKQEARTRNQFEIWRLDIANGVQIVGAEFVNALHGQLPVLAGSPYMDTSGAMKSMAELIDPMQSFASFLLNTHVRSIRKNIWGTTYYDERAIDLRGIPEGEVNLRVPVKSTSMDFDIRRHVYMDATQLDTKGNISDLGGTIDLMEKFFPVQMSPSQIAGIDRAIKSQVAEVKQGATRPLQQLATLLDEQAMEPARFQLISNILQYQPELEGGVKPNPAELPTLMRQIGSGLQSIDRENQANVLGEAVTLIAQNPQLAQQFDVAKPLRDWARLQDANIDVESWRIQKPAPTDPAEVAAREAMGAAVGEAAVAGGIPQGGGVPGQ